MHDRLIQIVSILLLVLGVGGAFLMTPSINEQRVERQLTYDVEVGDNANPIYTLVASLGSFRGLAINIMWQRSEELKNDGEFFESNRLAETITTLQPRYPEAWNFQGWNMAYNISVKCKTAEERWDWVQKGMSLIRDRGIPNNPNGVVLYRSLAWILGHKIAGQTDDMHWYYKVRFCEDWQTLLGVPDPRFMLKPEFRDPDNRPGPDEYDSLVHGVWVATEQFRQIDGMAQRYFKKPAVAEGDYKAANYFTTLSPDKLEQFYSDNPGLEQIVTEIAALRPLDADKPDRQASGGLLPDVDTRDLSINARSKSLASALEDGGDTLGLGMNVRTLRAFGRLQMYADAGYPLDSPTINNRETLGEDAMVLRNYLVQRDSDTVLNLNPLVDIDAQRKQLKSTNPGRDIVDLVPLLNLLRAQALISEYHMDPAYMLKCMERYGPLDWRHPSAHAVYWTALGTLRAEQWTTDKDRVDLVNANRATIHALQNLAHNGKISFRPKVAGIGDIGRETINHSPDTRMIPAYDVAWQHAIDMVRAGEFGEQHKEKTYEDGHENFLQAATYLYYFEGNQAMARRYFERVRELYGDRRRGTTATAAEGEYNLSLPDFARVRLEDDMGFQGVQLINYYIRLAWQRGLSQRSEAVMVRYLKAAENTHREFLEERQTEVRGDEDAFGRQNIPPLNDLILAQFIDMMSTNEFSLISKSAIWTIAKKLLTRRSNADQPLVYQAYAIMIPTLVQQAQAEGWGRDITSAFEPPNGFDAWYQQVIQQSNPAPGKGPLAPSANP